MLNIYGLTYLFSTNYGTCLQAFALQKTIEDIDIEGEKMHYMLIPVNKCPDSPPIQVEGMKNKLKSIVNIHTRKAFHAFEEKNMQYAPIKPFLSYNETGDAFVCGSDVIWNPKFNHHNTAYYLDFANKYAFSYAASFGQSDIDEASLQRIGSLISRLREISVRENGSAEIAKRCTKKQVEITVDPVLLLNREKWNEEAEKDNPYGQYIFVYSVNTSFLLRQFAKKLSRQTGLKVIYSGGNAGAVMKLRLTQIYTPERWLQLIRDAAYVVTDSFHGTAFSTIFRKPLFSIIEGDPDKGFNMRMSNYLKGIGLGERIYTTVPDQIDCTEIDYTNAEKLLRKKIQHSEEFLRRNLEAAYREKKEQESKET